MLVGLLWWLRTGDPTAPVAAQSRWLRQWQAPWRSVADAVRFAVEDLGAPPRGYYVLDLLVAGVAVVGVLVVGVVLVRTLRAVADGRSPRDHVALWAALATHGVGSVAVWLAQVFPGRPLMSVPRFALVVPAVLVGVAVATSRPGWDRVRIATSAVLLAVHLALFSRWYLVF